MSGEDNWDYKARVIILANRASKGVTRERQILKRQSLIDGMKNDYRVHFASIYGKSDKLPTAVFEKICETVDAFIGEQLARVNTSNVIGLRRGFHWAEKDMGFTERVVLTGENSISLEEQHLASTIFITQAEKRLKDLEAKPTPDHEAEKTIKERIMRLTVTRTFIEQEIDHQKKLATPVVS